MSVMSTMKKVGKGKPETDKDSIKEKGERKREIEMERDEGKRSIPDREAPDAKF